MKIYSVYDDEFKAYGRVVKGIKTDELIEAMNKIPMPESGVAYKPAIESLENCSVFKCFTNRVFGGMPCQLGMCWGYNTKLNCLEYHRDSEFNLGTGDFILLLAKLDEVNDMMLDTACVKAFKCPANTLIEVYATTLHYAPCDAKAGEGFRVLVGLPRGTNEAKPEICCPEGEDLYLTACNKWLLPHPDSSEAKGGAVVGLKGENIDIASDIK